jgi:hypothetical protein
LPPRFEVSEFLSDRVGLGHHVGVLGCEGFVVGSVEGDLSDTLALE